MAEAKKLGELLKEAGLIDDFQLGSALAHQRNWGGKLGSILVEMKFVTEEDVAKVIAEKLRVPFANLFEPGIPEASLKLLKPDLVRKYTVMPVKKDGTAVIVAMSDPLDIRVIDELRFITGFNIKPALALESEIKDAIRKYYDHKEVVRKPVQRPEERTPMAPAGKMEIIHGSELNMAKPGQKNGASPILSPEESAQQALFDNKTRLDALISLLIEKGLITRDEIVSMIYQKKMGL